MSENISIFLTWLHFNFLTSFPHFSCQVTFKVHHSEKKLSWCFTNCPNNICCIIFCITYTYTIHNKWHLLHHHPHHHSWKVELQAKYLSRQYHICMCTKTKHQLTWCSALFKLIKLHRDFNTGSYSEGTAAVSGTAFWICAGPFRVRNMTAGGSKMLQL